MSSRSNTDGRLAGETDVADPPLPLPPGPAVINLRDPSAHGRRAEPLTATMVIPVARAVGTGPTSLAAFDAALRLSGVANYNLVRLSSVIPPGSLVYGADAPALPRGNWGDRLYVVYAAQSATRPGDEAWAGIGWVQDPVDDRGLFVEHEGPTEQGVRDDIRATLGAMTAGREGDWNEPTLVVTGGTVVDAPICALVVAVYQSAPWTGAQP